MKHKIEIINLKIRMMEAEKKIKTNVRFENLDLTSKLTKVT